MDLQSLEKNVIREYDKRCLKSKVRYNELSKVVRFLRGKYGNSLDCLSKDKNELKHEYEQETGKKLNAAANSSFNELYNQYRLMNNTHVKSEVVPNHEDKTQVKKSKNTLCRNQLESFPPIIDADSEILILGTMPGPESLQTRQYYKSSHNSFWKIIAEVLNNGKTFLSYDEKLDCLRRNHIALWDVYQSCRRIAAADNTITNQIPNDIEGLLKKHPSIRRIILNGNKAAEKFHASVPYVQICSSASYITLEQKVKEWSKWLII